MRGERKAGSKGEEGRGPEYKQLRFSFVLLFFLREHVPNGTGAV